jgi:hypothetical protein
MWRVDVPLALKVAVTRWPRSDADRILAALREMRDDPFAGELYTIDVNSYYRVVGGYLIFFDVVPSEHRINVTAIVRPH